jgi:6-phosphogluconolactonase
MVMQNVTKTEAVAIISSALKENEGKKILYLLSGGSSAYIGVQALALVEESKRKNIVVALVDERFVPYDSPDSNAKLLKDLGILNYASNFIEILAGDSVTDRTLVAQRYQQKLLDAQADVDLVIAVLGVGSDNHTAGILPGINFDNNSVAVVDYSSEKFERISISPSFFDSIDILFAYIEGEEKEAAVNELQVIHDSVDYPAQLIKKAKQYEILYNKEKIA